MTWQSVVLVEAGLAPEANAVDWTNDAVPVVWPWRVSAPLDVEMNTSIPMAKAGIPDAGGLTTSDPDPLNVVMVSGLATC